MVAFVLFISSAHRYYYVDIVLLGLINVCIIILLINNTYIV
jgi:hypothetical protein